VHGIISVGASADQRETTMFQGCRNCLWLVLLRGSIELLDAIGMFMIPTASILTVIPGVMVQFTSPFPSLRRFADTKFRDDQPNEVSISESEVHFGLE